MSQLRDKMIEDLRLRGRAENTIDAYTRDVRKFFEWAKVTPSRVEPEHIHGFLLHLMDERHLSSSSQGVYVGALRFFFGTTMKRPELLLDIPRRKVPMRLPFVLARADVGRLIEHASSPKHRAIFEVLYGAGLRVSEVRKLRHEDVDSQGMVLHIRNAKRGRGRDALLSPRLLDTLRWYFKTCRPTGPYLFPGRDPGTYLTRAAIANAIRKAACRAGIETRVHPHLLRHAFATHLLENGVDLRTLQVLLGHSSMSSTTCYVHVTAARMHAICSPLDRLPREDSAMTP